MNGLEVLALTQAQGVMQSWERPSAGEWATVLATFPLFAGVSRRRLRRLVRKATFVEFAAGDRVVTGEERSDRLYVILGGAAKALRGPTARTLSVGDYFGEMALFGGAPRSAIVVATEELHVMRLPRQSALRLARQHPAITIRDAEGSRHTTPAARGPRSLVSLSLRRPSSSLSSLVVDRPPGADS